MNKHHHMGNGDAGQPGSTRPYWMFGLNLALSLVPMYLAMFTMIDGWPDYRNNLNMFYMALTMLAPMGMIMLATMRSMYGNKPLNLALFAGLTVLLVVSFVATRSQALVDDKQFVDSMVPHHSGAILMCREARLVDPELVQLCRQIVKAQREEIAQMNAIAARLRDSK